MGTKTELEIRKSEHFREGILRILHGLHEHSEKLIVARSRQHISIHELRKNIKKIRGILRLIRHEVGHEQYHKMNGFYRSIARQVAVLRDDTSQIELLESMGKKVPNKSVKRTLNSAIRQVEKKRKKEFETFYSSNLQYIIQQLLREQKQKIPLLPFTGEPEKFMLRSLHRIHHRARAAFETTLYVKNDEIYHYWRKQVKYLMYQLSILQNAWPTYFKTYINELNKLGNLLGKLHDLNLFNEHVHARELIVLNPNQKKDVLKYIYKKRAELKKRIEKIGERLFTESSDAFAMRLYDMWLLAKGDVNAINERTAYFENVMDELKDQSTPVHQSARIRKETKAEAE